MQTRNRAFTPLFTIVLLINIFSFLYYQNNEKFHREDWRGLTEHISENAKENSRVVFVRESQTEGYRYYDSGKELFYGEEGVIENLDEIWLMRYVWNVFDPQDLVRDRVEENYELKENLNFNGVVVYRYEKKN